MRVLASLLLLFSIAAAGAQLSVDAEERRSPPLGLDVYMPVPEDNPLTPEKVALGRRLFSDTLLSRDGTKACRSCHEPERAFTDGRPVAVGVRGQTGERNAPTLVNRGYGRSFFWDGRAPTLEAQVLEPIANPKELDLTIDEAVARLAHTREHSDRFQAVFARNVNVADLASALASYVRSILSGDSPLDRYMNGQRNALSAQARAGLAIFRGKGNCSACHVGPTLSDEQFHNTGVAWRDGRLLDEGRFVVTGKLEGHGAFKTPTLREITRTPPYMHDGSLATLKAVVDFYDEGGRPNPHIDPEIHPLQLTAEEKQALILFLQSLSGTIRDGVQ